MFKVCHICDISNNGLTEQHTYGQTISFNNGFLKAMLHSIIEASHTQVQFSL